MADAPAETVTLNYEKIVFDHAISADGDSFDFKAADEKQEIGLLLPAVQAAREARRQEEDEAMWMYDAGDDTPPDVHIEAGLRSDGELVQADVAPPADDFMF